jgi:hypothetical protein
MADMKVKTSSDKGGPGMVDLELALAVLSGLCGLAASVCVVRRHPAAAGFLGGVGLFVCNVVWLLRLG